MDIHTDRENEGKSRRNYIELAIAAVVGVGIGLAIGWQLAGRHYGEELAELQWKLEMQEQAAQEQQELEEMPRRFWSMWWVKWRSRGSYL